MKKTKFLPINYFSVMPVMLFALTAMPLFAAESWMDVNNWTEVESTVVLPGAEVSSNIVVNALTGDSLDNLYARSGQFLYQLDTQSLTWSEMESWTTYLNGNDGAWIGTGVPVFAATQDNIFVAVRAGTGDQRRYVAHFDGDAWATIDTGGGNLRLQGHHENSVAAWGGNNFVAVSSAMSPSEFTTIRNAGTIDQEILTPLDLAANRPEYVSATADGALWAARATDNVMWRSIDGGESWAQTVTGVRVDYMNGFWAVDEDIAVIGSSTTIINRTLDGGISWDTLNASARVYTTYAESYDRIWAMGAMVGIDYTVDGGVTWGNLAFPGTQYGKMLNIDGHYFAGRDGVLYTTIPEPGSLALLGLAGLLLLKRRRF